MLCTVPVLTSLWKAGSIKKKESLQCSITCPFSLRTESDPKFKLSVLKSQKMLIMELLKTHFHIYAQLGRSGVRKILLFLCQ